MANQDVEELFARLKSAPSNPSAQESVYQPPAVSSPIFSPPHSGTPPLHSSDVISPAMGTPASDPRTKNLLSLLKFNSSGNTAQTSAQPMSNPASRPSSAADVFSAFQRPPPATANPSAAVGAERQEGNSFPPANQKDYLLNLLNGPKNAAAGAPRTGSPATVSTPSIEPVEKLAQSFAQTTVEAPQPKPSIFTHVNPFDQLHASSPLNISPRPDTQGGPKKIEILKHSRQGSTTTAQNEGSPDTKSRKVNTTEPSNAPLPRPAEEKSQSVAEALEDVGQTVGKEVEQALAQATAENEASVKTTEPGALGESSTKSEAAAKEPRSAENDDVESSWESAESEEKSYEVDVYNFPMKPFVSIQINSIQQPRAVRQDGLMVIAQLKKEFDQVDRTLVTASQTHIVYAQLGTKKDNGGFRVIRQDTGDHKQIFRSSGERIFSIQLCGDGTDVETVLGTGVNGSIFWTSLIKSRGELFLEDDVESNGIIMPPVATPEEQTSGSPVKTRAKMSSRHPEFFGIARGKQIHIIAPQAAKNKPYCNPKTRKVNSEKFLADYSLKIMTGKAGKDFCFSEDDTTIVSLDKSGRLKFWDIKELTILASDPWNMKYDPVELTEPVWTFTAAASGSKSDEKPSVSSVMLLDKEKPTVKGTALRYLIIGFKQNHIIQLYDLALKKAVQEVRLPHEKDSDGFCSITYHPRTGIIAIGHPTRNSIYLIHLSAPRYNLGNIDQAKFISILAKDDAAALPKPETTAIMSGVREFSFAKLGTLRSVDMLREPVEDANDPDTDEATMFELYVMHSKGTTCVGIKRKDLGWDKNGRMVKPFDAVESNVATVKPMEAVVSQPTSDPPSNSDVSSQKATPSKPKDSVKPANPKSEIKTETAPTSTSTSNMSSRTVSATPEPSTALGPETTKSSQELATKTAPAAPESYAKAAQQGKSPTKEKAVQALAGTGKGPDLVPSTTATTTQISDMSDLQASLNKQFDSLYQRIDSDKRVQDASGAAKQDAMLRLVSTTLTENVEKSLDRIIMSCIEREVIPNISNTTSKVIEKSVADSVPQLLNDSIAKEVKAVLPSAIQQALKDAQVQRTISDQIAGKVQQQVSGLMQQAMPNLATQASQKMMSDLEHRTNVQLREAEHRRNQDNAQINELSNLVRSLSQTIQTLSDNQAAFQSQMINMQQAMRVAEPANDTSVAPEPPAAPEDQEVRKIEELLQSRQFDPATLAWLQSPRQPELFDLVFVRVNPVYLEHVSPLIALSVSAAITTSFDSNVDRRLEWLGTVLANINLQDPDIRDVAPKIMDVLSHRLQGAYMQISEANPNDAALRRISALNRQVNEVRRLAG